MFAQLKYLVSILLMCCVFSAQAAVNITRTSSPEFYIDTGTSPQLLGQYVSYQITNNDQITYDDLWVKVTNFSGGVVGLASNEDGEAGFGSVAPGATVTAYFYLAASAATAVVQGHDVEITNGKPGVGVSLTTTGDSLNTFTAVSEPIAANSNKVNTVVIGPATPALGGLMTITVTGDTGTIGSAKVFSMSPATYADWPASAYQLLSAQVTMTGGNNIVYNDELYRVLANTSNTAYTLVYTFRAIGITSQSSSVSPVANISSGTQIKHTSTGNFASFPPVLPAVNNTVIGTKTASTGVLPTGVGGIVTYTVGFTNQHLSVDAVLDEIVDTLPSVPATAIYQANTASFNGTLIEPGVSGSTLTWSGQFVIPANSTVNLIYDVLIPVTDGAYANSVIAKIDSEQIDATLDTTDSSPQFVYVTVGAPEADLVTQISVDAASPSVGQSITYTIDVLNNGTAAATGISITDLLPGGVTYVSDDAAGDYISATGVWTVVDLAINETTSLNIVATVDTGTSGNTITNTITAVSLTETDPTVVGDITSVDLTVIVGDVTPPAVPTVDSISVDSGASAVDGITNDNLPVIAGTWDELTAVALTVTVDGTPYVLAADAELTSDGSGNWSLDLTGLGTPLADATYDVAVSTADAASNTSVDATTDEFEIDTSISTPTVTAQITNDITPVISGLADASTAITVIVGGATYTTTATVGGSWSIDTATAPDSGTFVPDVNGDNTVFVTSIDVAGNTASDVTINELSIDTTAPVVTIDAAPVATAANAATYPVSGSCTVGDGNVSVVVSGAVAITLNASISCSAGGTWSTTLNVSAITDGLNAITINASQTDSVSNQGDATPVLADKDAIAPAAPTVVSQTTSDTTPVITGTAEASSTVTVVVGGATYTTVADGSGIWSLDTGSVVPDSGVFAPDVNGSNDVDATATDAAGNTSLVDATSGELVIDTSGPAVPTVDTITDDTGSSNADGITSDTLPVIGGTWDEAIATSLSVTIDSVTYVLGVDAELSSDGSGNWTLDLTALATPLAENIYDVAVSTTDAVANIAIDATTNEFQIDLTLPAIPTAATLITIDPTPVISGTAVVVAGDVVTVIVGGATYTVVPDGLDNWVLNLATAIPDSGSLLLNTGGASGSSNDVTVTIIDTAGNVSTDISSGELSIDVDNDNDGIPDVIEIAQALNAGDSDGDGTADELDVDSDGDGIPDAIERGASGIDTDGDGIDDTFDVDQTGGVDANGDGVDDNIAPVDSDNDGTPDYLDVDSDNDGIPDAIEAGTSGVDTDGDGIDDTYDVDQTGGTDVNGDGIDNNVEVDTDSDGIPDVLDVDSDNDGIPDVIEGGAVGIDTDGDGIDDTYDVDQTGGTDANGDGIDDNAAVDTDGDGTPDAQDVDSDGDGISDTAEGGVTGADTDGDGIDDAYDIDIVGGPDANGDGIKDDVIPVDTDGDGILDIFDPDSDNDGIPDAIEGDADSDGDGIIDSQDTDSDGDGVPDAVEAGTSGVDTDGDGIDDTYDVDQTGGTDANGDGIDDGVILDSDGDGVADSIDKDNDGDGIPDVVENGGLGVDSNGNGIDDAFDVLITGGNDANGDGIDDDIIDADGDGIANAFDIDSDGDGVPDAIEGGASGVDTDADGIDDSYDVDVTGGVDANLDGIDDNFLPLDTDLDGAADYLDLDSDNDGIPDTVEGDVSGLDTDGDGIDDTYDVDQTGGVDANGDGIDDNAAIDSDADGIADTRDRDSDADGIPDAVEGGASGLDTDGDGIDDVYDVDVTGGVDANGDGVDDNIKAIDTDADGIPDYQDLDADGDGIIDATEADTGSELDSDGDGVLDIYDVDETGGVDANADGVDDAVSATDTDGDSVPDYRDLDSDNDSIPDVTEAGLLDDNDDGLLDAGEATTDTPFDSGDGDGVADYRDVDSDGDGAFDIAGTDNAALDADLNGEVDPTADADGDGVDDSVDGDPAGFGLSNDTDGDGISNTLDLDDDNDGIPDTAETDALGNDIDTDGDGIVDRLDRDSDNDGIPDSVEATGDIIDADADGVVDNFTDANSDGLDDNIATTLIPVDTDGDNTPDFRDLDSDGDGLNDLYEANGFSAEGDSNGDGILDNLVDIDGDGFADIVDTNVEGGSSGEKLSNPDTDGDGISNYRETDSDGDGFGDLVENGDFDGNGVPDNLQVDGGLETSVRGIGSVGPLSGLLLLLLPVLLRSRRVFPGRIMPLFALMFAAFSATASSDINYCGRHNPLDADEDKDFKKCFYLGAGWLPVTHVRPEGISAGWRTSDDSDAGYDLFVGWHFKPQWFGELSYADLGEAGLTNINPAITGTEGISYKIPALHVGYYLFAPESRFNVYGKVGLSAIQNEATTSLVPFDKQNNVTVSGGVGAQWRSRTSGLFARLAADFYDKDARSIGIMLGYYLGSSKQVRQNPVKMPEPQVVPISMVAPVVEVVAVNTDTDSDGVNNDNDACPATEAGARVDSKGCTIADISLKGVNFENNSASLTSDSKIILDKAAATLLEVLDVRVEVQAHTDSVGSKKYNQKLSDRRAASVRDYLVSQGVDAAKLESKGYGETDPILTNETEDGRAGNRRVELKMLEEKSEIN